LPETESYWGCPFIFPLLAVLAKRLNPSLNLAHLAVCQKQSIAEINTSASLGVWLYWRLGIKTERYRGNSEAFYLWFINDNKPRIPSGSTA